MARQIWFCEVCFGVGAVDLYGGDDVASVVGLISDDHKSRSPTCTLPVEEVRVHNGSIDQLPTWVRDAIRSG